MSSFLHAEGLGSSEPQTLLQLMSVESWETPNAHWGASFD